MNNNRKHGLALLIFEDYISLVINDEPVTQLIFKTEKGMVLTLMVEASSHKKSSMLTNFLQAISADTLNEELIDRKVLAEILLIDDLLDSDVPKILAFLKAR